MDEAGGDGVIHECPECGIVFGNLRGLRTHYSQMHPDSGSVVVDPNKRIRIVFRTTALLDKRHKRWMDGNVTSFSEWVRTKIDEEMKQQELEALE